MTLQRLGELAYSARNTRRLISRGAFEVAPGHYPLIVTIHALWLGSLWVLAWDRDVIWSWIAIFAVLQVLRFWVIATLGERWTTRIIVVPEARLVRSGPYRAVKHPNYLVVTAEIAVLPLAFGLPVPALVFTVLNAAVLLVRVRAEDRALDPR